MVGALSPPIVAATTFERQPAAQLSTEGSADGASQPAQSASPTYTRDQNPTYLPAERTLAALEKGQEAMLFSSGMAAATAALETLLPGQQLVAPKAMYWALRSWIVGFAKRRAIEVTWVDPAQLSDWQAAITQHTTLVWLESPSNPLLQLTDLEAVCALAKAAGAVVVADNTTATPILCRPLELGADVVMHSATKALNGHSDVCAGALVTRDNQSAFWRHCRDERLSRGGVPGPFEAWLLQRGMRTLALRVKQACRNAQQVAEYLEAHAEVTQVFYPGLPSHPQFSLAKQQLNGGFGALLSFRVRGGGQRTSRVAGGLQLFRQATSLGGVESLVEQRALVEGPASGLPEDLLRLSVGIEASQDLLNDLGQALASSA